MATEPYGVRGDGGGREAYGVAENSGGNRQGVQGGVESPQGIDTPGVAELPRGDETPGVTTAGEGVPGEDGRGQGGDKTPPPSELARKEDPAAATRIYRTVKGRRSHRARSGTGRQTTTVRGPCHGNSTAPTTPGSKTAHTRDVSAAYWRQRIRRGLIHCESPGKG